MNTRQLGSGGPTVSALGLGCMGMSDVNAALEAERDRLDEALAALDVELGEDDLKRIEAAIPPGAAAGDRYPEGAMAMLDSER